MNVEKYIQWQLEINLLYDAFSTHKLHIKLRLCFKHVFVYAVRDSYKLGVSAVLSKLAVEEHRYFVRKPR